MKNHHQQYLPRSLKTTIADTITSVTNLEFLHIYTKAAISTHFNNRQPKTFLDFVLSHYVREEVKAGSRINLRHCYDSDTTILSPTPCRIWENRRRLGWFREFFKFLYRRNDSPPLFAYGHPEPGWLNHSTMKNELLFSAQTPARMFPNQHTSNLRIFLTASVSVSGGTATYSYLLVTFRWNRCNCNGSCCKYVYCIDH